MDVDLAHLRALRAAVDEGSLDGAARVLHVTPSAISQRLKALELSAGRVVLVRSKPVRVTEAGRMLLRLARQIELVTAEAVAEVADEAGGPVELALAVNADSLATWLVPALAELRDEMTFDLHRHDEEETAALLRDGTVVAAVTSAAATVAGCRASPLGTMRYRPAATPAFVRTWFPQGPTVEALQRSPVVHFDRSDDLQRGWLRARCGDAAAPPASHVPSSDGFERAVRCGLGWGMLTEWQLTELADDVEVVDPDVVVEVPLFWQRWKLRSASLDRLSDVVLAAGRRALGHPSAT
ncbi:ArgP/LysG family DNA-binding transcriptional regulator [Egicoccus halophilus]|uniref:Transcriptional regulator ArgP n=1 Tax=Egicoccus halophilus TaxID=1670830 RepID=A0A8J3AHT8_9ACTN|nr:ArgP/LysG family DNA-binding transcriptional regulator [Egicoccus halophilus]GGI09009.1 transcriptional regulator ArgP [Egicoccus halophilus]